MLRTKVHRPGKWTAIPLGIRIACSRDICQVCDVQYGKIRTEGDTFIIPVQHLDHLIPRRWLAERDINPHQIGNLLSVCGADHGKKKGFEDRLFQGDLFSFLQGLKTVGYPIHKVVKFALSVGLKEFGQWQF